MKNIFKLFIAVLLVFLLMGCEESIENPTSTPELFVTPTFLASETFTPEANTSTPTQEILPTPTALPTLSPDNAMRLLQEDFECKFPCFWGLIPGETSFLNALNRLNTFTTLGFLLDSNPKDEMCATYIEVPVDNEKMLGITFDFFGNNNTLQWLVVNIGLVTKQRPINQVFDKILLEKLAHRLSLPQVLSTYGQPSEIKIFTYSAVLQGTTDEFKLLLLYPEQGFMVEYITPAGVYIQSGKPNQMIGCFADAYVHFWLWQPSKETTIDDIISQTNGIYLYSYMYDKYRTIGDVTDLSLEEFYTKFTTADGRQCLMTPQDFWSVP
jgi:hypothetical protein